MNYKLHYDRLISRSHLRVLEGYTEEHHIVPRCLGGSDSKENLAILTAEEHFVAHQLLVKIYPKNRDLIYATQMMTFSSNGKRNNNKLFGWLRRQLSESMSIQMTKWYEENEHPRGMKDKKHTEEKKQQIAITTKESMSELKGVRVYVYDLAGKFEQEFRTLTDCANAIGAKPINVKHTAEGRFTHCKGKQIRYDFVESIPPRKSRTAGNKQYELTCPHCNKEGRGPAMKRFHFDRCKLKEFIDKQQPLGEEFEKVLQDNLWTLYEESNK